MKKLFKNGISIRVIHIAMLVCAAAIVGLLIYSTTKSSSVFTIFPRRPKIISSARRPPMT